jgi:hypothetical protein
MNSTRVLRISAYLTVLGVAALSIAGTASAAPTITSFRIKAVPIPGFPGTGEGRLARQTRDELPRWRNR